MDIHDARESLSVRDADITGSSFVNANLEQCTFDDVTLRGSTFTNVNLAGVTLDDVNLSNASISNANLTGARIHGVLIADALHAGRWPAKDVGQPEVRSTATRAGAVLYAKDLARMRQFYEYVIGLCVENEAADHVVLGSPALQLVLVRAPDHIASSIDITTPPTPRTHAAAKMRFHVESLEAARALAAEHGGELQPPEREWDFLGDRICDGFDPEGNVIQLLQVLR